MHMFTSVSYTHLSLQKPYLSSSWTTNLTPSIFFPRFLSASYFLLPFTFWYLLTGLLPHIFFLSFFPPLHSLYGKIISVGSRVTFPITRGKSFACFVLSLTTFLFIFYPKTPFRIVSILVLLPILITCGTVISTNFSCACSTYVNIGVTIIFLKMLSLLMFLSSLMPFFLKACCYWIKHWVCEETLRWK